MMEAGVWAKSWERFFGISTALPPPVIAALGMTFLHLCFVFPLVWVVLFFERKLGADLQARIGPNRTGLFGFFQPIADIIKLFKKRTRGITTQEAVWEMALIATLFSTVAILPTTEDLVFLNTGLTLIFPVLIFVMIALWAMFLGISRETVIGVLGAVRILAKATTAAFPVLVSLLCVGIRSGGMSWTQVIHVQGVLPHQWNAFSNPFLFVAFIIFVLGGLIALSIPPFDGSQGVSLMEYRAECVLNFSGTRLGLFYYSRTYALVMWCMAAAGIFLGGWNVPSFMRTYIEAAGVYPLAQFFEVSAVLVKTFVLVTVVIWVSRVSSRQRTDHVTDWVWKLLGPVSLLALMGTAIWESGVILR